MQKHPWSLPKGAQQHDKPFLTENKLRRASAHLISPLCGRPDTLHDTHIVVSPICKAPMSISKRHPTLKMGGGIHVARRRPLDVLDVRNVCMRRRGFKADFLAPPRLNSRPSRSVDTLRSFPRSETINISRSRTKSSQAH